MPSLHQTRLSFLGTNTLCMQYIDEIVPLISLSGQKTEKSLSCPIRGEICPQVIPMPLNAYIALVCVGMYVQESVSSRSQNLLDESKIP